SPAAYCLIADLFPKTKRGTALGIYSLGIYIGIGLSTFVGGRVVDGWSAAFPAGGAPFGLVGWQAAFLTAGLPGLLLVPVVLLMREPMRVVGAAAPGVPGLAPWRLAAREAMALLPPTSFFFLRQDGLSVSRNLVVFGAFVLVTMGLTRAFGDVVQWLCLSLG